MNVGIIKVPTFFYLKNFYYLCIVMSETIKHPKHGIWGMTPAEKVKAPVKKPEWCMVPAGTAEHSVLGCWSLLDGKIKYPTDCIECEFKKGYNISALVWEKIAHNYGKENDSEA